MKGLMYLTTLVLLSSVAFAQTGLMGYGGKSSPEGWIMAILYFAVMSFVFSAVFWLTHNWLAKKK